MTIAYLLFRVSDYLEDNAVTDVGEKVRLLNLWDAVLAGQEEDAVLLQEAAGLEDDDPEGEVLARVGEITEALDHLDEPQQRVMRRRVRQTTQGMARRLILGPVVHTEEELDSYMHSVAGLVGYLITDVFSIIDRHFAARRSRLLALAHEYGLGLQTVNVIRGLRKDASRGRFYLPLGYLRDLGLSPEQLFAPQHLEHSLTAVRRLAEKAEDHLRSGLGYVLQIPRSLHRVRLATMWPLLFAARTLAVSRDNRDVLFSEAKISREDVRSIVRRSSAMGWSNRWIARYHERLLRGRV
jgi:phytoene/squalene synthetase